MPESKRRNGRDKKVAELRRAGAVMLGGQPQRVRTAKEGRPIPCVWSDCWRDGDNRYRIEARNPDWKPEWGDRGKHIVYIFCSERHKEYWLSEARQLAAGMTPRV